MRARQAAFLQEKAGKEREALSLSWLKVGCLLNEFVEGHFGCAGVSPLVNERFQVIQSAGKAQHNDGVARHGAGSRFLVDAAFRELEFEEGEGWHISSKKVEELMSECFTTVIA